MTSLEVKEENELPSNTLLDKDKKVILPETGTLKVIVVSAVFTHLRCILILYFGAYKWWVTIKI